MHPNSAPHDATHLQVMRLLQANPHMMQRELAQALGVSLGKTNFCLQALLASTWNKVWLWPTKTSNIKLASNPRQSSASSY